MAKWGEGDPRWIVEDRPDATNVNNWHWTEKNATPWSKDKLTNLLKDFVIAENNIECKITEIETLTGEATANNRKGKLIFFYEWNIVLKWTGSLPGEVEGSHEGKITIPNLSEENDVDEFDIAVTINESNDNSEKLKSFMYNVGRDKIRNQLGEYVRTLKNDFTKGLILPKKDDPVNSPNITSINNSKNKPTETVNNITSGFNKKIDMQPAIDTKKEEKLGCKLDTTTLKFCIKFQCSAKELYDALTRIEMVTAFTRGHVKMNPSRGGDFLLFEGNISGKFEALIPNKKIVQTWRYKQWPAGHFSNVDIEFVEKDDCTELQLTQTGVPTAEADATSQNWHRYYFQSIRNTFGFGPNLLLH